MPEKKDDKVKDEQTGVKMEEHEKEAVEIARLDNEAMLQSLDPESRASARLEERVRELEASNTKS